MTVQQDTLASSSNATRCWKQVSVAHSSYRAASDASLGRIPAARPRAGFGHAQNNPWGAMSTGKPASRFLFQQAHQNRASQTNS